MGNVRGKNNRPLDQREDQREDHHHGHLHKEVPQGAVNEEEARKGNHRSQDRRKDGRQYVYRPVQRRLCPRQPLLVVAIDVLPNYDTIIDQDTDHDDHSEERDDVQRDIQRISKNEHARKADGDRQGHPEGQPPVQEDRQQDGHDEKPLDSVGLQGIHPLPQGYARITDHGSLYGIVLGVELLDVVLYPVGDEEHILFQGILHLHAHTRGAVQKGPVGLVGPAVGHVGDLT